MNSNPHGLLQQAVLAVLDASPHPLTTATVAMRIKHDPSATKFAMNKLCKKDLIHVIGTKAIYGAKANLYRIGAAPVVTYESLMGPWIAAARAKLEQRA